MMKVRFLFTALFLLCFTACATLDRLRQVSDESRAAGDNLESSPVAAVDLPGEAVPDKAVPGKVVPGKVVLDEAVPDNAVPDNAVPDEVVATEVVLEEVVPDDAGLGEAVLDEAAPDEAAPTEVVPTEVVLDQAVPTEVVPDEVVETTSEGEVERDTEDVVIAYIETNYELDIRLESVDNPAIKLCHEVGAKLGSVSISDCLNQNLVHSAFTTARRSLAFKDYPPLAARTPLGRVLVIGGIHGDEYSSVSVLLKWMKILDRHHSGLFHWRFVPAANPDGLLRTKSQRQNHNGVDLNRNFPTSDWDGQAWAHWEQETNRNPRRHPGHSPASELETQWLVKQIEEFKPDVIISMHAPYHLVDYDGPPSAPEMLGALRLRQLGVFPGSLGNYAGIDLQMPIVTVELMSAGIMPTKKEIDQMWKDLVRWLRGQLSKQMTTGPPEAAGQVVLDDSPA